MYILNKDLELEKIDDNTLVFIYDSGKFFKLNSMGSQIMQLIINKKTSVEIIKILANDYDAPTSKIEKDVHKFLDEMIRNKILLKK